MELRPGLDPKTGDMDMDITHATEVPQEHEKAPNETETVFQHKGKLWFQINELEIEADDVEAILHGNYGYTRNVALDRLAKALDVALDKEQKVALKNLAEA